MVIRKDYANRSILALDAHVERRHAPQSRQRCNASIAGSSAGLAAPLNRDGHRHGQSPQRLQALGTLPLGIHATQSVCEDSHDVQREKRVLVHQEEKPPLIDRRQTTI